LWMSSLAAHADAYDPDDWQLVDGSQPYEGTKFQIDLIRAELSRRAGPSSPVRHFTVHPGVVYSSIDAALVGSFMSQLKVAVFYLVRLPLSFSPTNASSSLISGPRVFFFFFFVGQVVWFFTPQHLILEWCRRCGPHLPCITCIHSCLSFHCRRPRRAGQGTGRSASGASAFHNGSHGTQWCCSRAIL
jgi:hypothetical protein